MVSTLVSNTIGAIGVSIKNGDNRYLFLFARTSRPLRSREWCKNQPFVVLTRFQNYGNWFPSERRIFENVFVRCGGNEGFYIPPATRPGQNLLAGIARRFRSVLLRTAAGLCLCAARSRPLSASRKAMPPKAGQHPFPCLTVAEGITH